MKTMESLKVLIVDDENVVRETLSAMLEYFGHKTDLVGEGIAGKKAMRNTRYDAAFVDMRMPGIDGMSLLKWSKEAQLNLPIIVMTGHGDKDARDEALKYGAFTFLNKPFSLKDIKHLLAEIQSR
jgi:DNA-binding NtrC family response regulator